MARASQYSSASEQVTEADDFRSAASSPSRFSQPSTITSNQSSQKMAKIIDIQKTRHNRRSDLHHQTTTGEDDESRHNRNTANPTGAATAGGGGTRAGPLNVSAISSSSQPTTLDSSASHNNSQQATSNRWSPQVNPRGTSQKQPSGETLSSFESDYDLLVYLGETETEDLVDTERSLDYQDQTWRQSICGASLAPTIDESLSELAGPNSGSAQAQDFELLNTPTPFGIPSSPFAAPPSRSLSSHQLTDAAPGTSLARQQQDPRRPWQAGPAASGTQARRLDYECDSEVSLAFSRANQRPNLSSSTYDTQVNNNQRTPRESDYANLTRLQQPTANSGRQVSQVDRMKSSTLAPNTTLNSYSSQINTENTRIVPDHWTMTNATNRPANNYTKSNTMGRNQMEQVAGGDELDRLLAEMSQSLDLDSLARYDTQPKALTISSRPANTVAAYGRGEQMPVYTPRPDTRSKSSLAQKVAVETPVERQQARPHQQAASSESILDEYDGASRMLEQMISDQLGESAATPASVARKQQQPPPPLRPQRPQNQRADSLSQSLHSADTGSRDSPKSVIVNYNFPSRRSTQRPTLSSGRGSRSSVAPQEGSAGSPVPFAGTGSRKVSTCSSSADASVVLATPAVAQEPSDELPLEKRSIWRAGGRKVSTGNRQRNTSESSAATRKSVESSQAIIGRLVERQPSQAPPTPPKKDYQEEEAENQRMGVAEFIRAEAAEIPAVVSSDEGDPIRVQESQMNRMKRRTMSGYRSMRNKISEMMAAGDKDGAQRRQKGWLETPQPPAERPPKRSQVPQPPKRSSSIGSRSDVSTGRGQTSEPSDSQSRESRALRRRRDQPEESTSKSSFGQQIRERLSRSKSRLSKLLLPDRARRAQSQPGGPSQELGARKLEEGAAKSNELLFQPGDLARNWPTSGEPKPLPVGLKSPTPARDLSSQSSLSGLDVSSSPKGSRPTRAARRKQSATGRPTGSRPPSLISLKRWSSSFRSGKDRKSDEGEDSLGMASSSPLSTGHGDNKGKKSGKRARRRRRRAAAGSPLGGSAANSPSGNQQKLVTARVATTDDYFGQVAPPRVDSPVADNGPAEPPEVVIVEPAKRPNRSQSLRSVRLVVPAQSAEAEVSDSGERVGAIGGGQQKRTVSFSNLNCRRLPTTTNTFRPASACAQLEVEPSETGSEPGQAQEVSLSPPTPVGPSNTAPTTGLESVKFKPIPPPFGQHLLRGPQSDLRAEKTRSKSAAAMLDDIRHKCSSLFATASGGARVARRAPSPIPRRPPRAQRVRSKSAMAAEPPSVHHEDEEEEAGECCQVIEVSAATPNSTMERPPRRASPSKSRLGSLAQHLKHSASDFFNQTGDGRRERSPQRAVAATQKQQQQSMGKPTSTPAATQEEASTLLEWRPVIAVRDAKLANRSAARSIVAGAMKLGKDGLADEDVAAKKEAPKGSATLDRTGPSQIARFKNLQRRQQLQQQSLDTDTTWDSSEEDDDDDAGDGPNDSARRDAIECKINDSRVVQVRDARRDESSAQAGQSATKAGPAQGGQALTSCATESSELGRSDNTGNNESTEGRGRREAIAATQDKLAQASSKELNADDNNNDQNTSANASHLYDDDKSLNNNNNNNSNNNNNHSELLKRAKREFEGKEEAEEDEQLLQREQQVALQLAGNSKKNFVRRTSAENLSQQPQIDVELRQQDRQQAGRAELSNCNSRAAFKFSANLPTPAQARENSGNNERQQVFGVETRIREEENSEPATREAQQRSRIPRRRQIEEPREVSRSEQDDEPSADRAPMAAALARPSAGPAAGPRTRPPVLDQADAQLLDSLGLKKPRAHLAPDPNRTDESPDEAQKRLSVYENMPQQQAVAEEQRQRRGWRKPPGPPEKPARLRQITSAAATATESPPGSPEIWSVGDDTSLPKLPAHKLRQLNEALDGGSPHEPGERPPEVPAKPKRRLVTMTSIIQEPEDELMVAAEAARAQLGVATAQASFGRRDSALSMASLAGDNNNSDDSDSSFASAAASRRRLVSKFQSSTTAGPAPRPKFPAFEEGKSAPMARGQSLVKRLAKTFDQTVQEQPAAAAAAGSAKPPVRGGPASGQSQADEPKSESGTITTWYDAKSSEQLDEAEVARFLADFDQHEERRESSATVSEEVSTGADPFVTVADSTLEERLAVGEHHDKQEVEDDDTLNDGLDEVEDDLNELGEEEEAVFELDDKQGKDNTNKELPLAKSASSSTSTSGGASYSTTCTILTRPPPSPTTCSGPESESGEPALRELVSGTQNNNNNNNNNNNDAKSGRTSRYDLGNSHRVDRIGIDHATAADKPSLSVAVTEENNAIVAPAASTTFPSSSKANTSVAAAAADDDDDVVPATSIATTPTTTTTTNTTTTTTTNTPNEPTTTDALGDDDDNVAASISNPAIAHTNQTIATDTNSSLTTGAHPIDIKFKNSLNQIIARRSSQMGPIEAAAETGPARPDQATMKQQNNNNNNNESDTKTKKKTIEVSGADNNNKCLVANKELKGLSRYYHALLGGGKTRKKQQQQQQQQQPVDHVKEEEPVGKAMVAQMDDCIHSSSSSAASSSYPSISSSPVTSRSPSLISSCNSSPAPSDDEDQSESNEKDRVSRRLLRQMDNKKLARDAKKCSRLYEELEKILASRIVGGQAQDHQVVESGKKTKEMNANVEEDVEAANDFGAFYSWSMASDGSGPLLTGGFAPDDQISLSSSSVSSESIPEIRQRQNLQKLYHVVNEIHSSEAKFVDTLRLLNEDFRRHMTQTTVAVAGNDCIASILKHLPQLQALNENLLEELRQARDQWPRTKKIAHVLVKIGPFLKHYSTYIREFDGAQQQLVEAMRKYPSFGERVRQFEATDRCQKLTIQHHLLRPIQRIPQYRLLLQQYLHHLKPDDVDYEDTVNALEVVSRVAEHANQSMNEGANFAKLLALQAKIVGKQRDIVQPGRLFVKEGELLKVCRKQVQPRWFVLLNDALLYLTQIQSSDILYLNNELPLDDCQISTPCESKQSHNLIGQQFEREFSVCTKTRSFALIAKSRLERDQWVDTFRKTIEEHLTKRRSFSIRQQEKQQQQQQLQVDVVQPEAVAARATSQPKQGHLLGQKAPLWTPDSRVSMCQLCTSSFSALFRRHHCRSCGRVTCSACSSNRAPLVYLKCRSARVCDHCFHQLRSNIPLYYLGGSEPASNQQEVRRLDEHFRTLLKSQFVRHAAIKGLKNLRATGSAGSQRPEGVARSSKGLLNERLGANDSGSTISGYLHRRHETKAKWKRQWFVIRNKVLYAYRAIDDVAAISSIPLLGFSVDQPQEPIDCLEPKSLIRLRHLSDYARRHSPSISDSLEVGQRDQLERKSSKVSVGKTGGKGEPVVIQHLFKAESVGAAERWLEAFKSSVVLDGGGQAEQVGIASQS